MMVRHKALKGNQFCERAHAKIDIDRPSQSPLDRFVPEAEDRVIRSWSERSRYHLTRDALYHWPRRRASFQTRQGRCNTLNCQINLSLNRCRFKELCSGMKAGKLKPT
ncbi:hypothetical protein ELI38_00985 [Rhizobium leguminosarum]|nr:hypothetical protein ELI38_00985 [Rhizobium leguminosarum]TAW50049.1 hypothetical protein ELI14_00990 [Rhizobium leguminosarum]TAX48921.1 hypothetical protein ELH99_01070 [Rhizobium leguminosarum]TAZ59925.1 hypothetical protein ELH75_01060 [Rhizobium leguminosarum]